MRERLVVLALALTLARPAHAQSETELRTARELFQEALHDEEAKRYADALAKFQRVAKVKETAAVRYRIATVLESLGRLREAHEGFRAIAQVKNATAAEADIVASAGERARTLEPRIPRVAIVARGGTVRLDEAPVPDATPVLVDPGEHVLVQENARGAQLRSRVRLSEGAAATLELPEPAGTAGQVNRPAMIAFAGAAGLLTASGILLAVRATEIGRLYRDCPNGACPAERRDELEARHDRAQVFGPVGGVLGVLGIAAAGAGMYFLLRPLDAQLRAGAGHVSLTRAF